MSFAQFRRILKLAETPEVLTPRLCLNTFSRKDANDVFDYCSNPNVARFTSWNVHQTLADSKAFIAWARQMSSCSKKLVQHVWAIRLKGHSYVIGSIDFCQISNDEGRLNYALGERAWGKGYATEAALGILAWAFQTIASLQVVRSGGISENKASMRVLEKCGMVFAHERKRWFKQLNGYFLVSDYYITRLKWIQKDKLLVS